MRKNAYFQLIHRENKMYLKSFPPEEKGSLLDLTDVVNYFEIKKIQDVEKTLLKQFVEQANASEHSIEMKILTGTMLPEKELIQITIDPQARMAKIRMYPPSSEGTRLSVLDVKELIHQSGVVSGIHVKNLQILLKYRLYCMDILLAKAKEPVPGKDAYIEYGFNIEKTRKPKLCEDGSVDFHDLDMMEIVEAGQVLAKLTPASEGISGIDVRGAAIAPPKVKQMELKHGNHIHLSEDQCTMYADIAGDVSVVDGTVFLSDSYEVPADVGPSTGDVDYQGDVIVKGNVLTGYTVKASGDIVVNGVVEGAILQAGGKIILKRGIQGMERADISARSDIITNFIESAKVSSGGCIVTDAILHSQVSAQGRIDIHGKRGLVVGGHIRSKCYIDADFAGSTMGTLTNLEVGIDPVYEEEYHVLERELQKLEEEKASLLQNLKILKKRMDAAHGKLDADKQKILITTSRRIQEIEVSQKEKQHRYQYLQQEIKSQGPGKIVIENTVYSGVKLTISNINTTIKTQAQHSAFVREGADIRLRGI